MTARPLFPCASKLCRPLAAFALSAAGSALRAADAPNEEVMVLTPFEVSSTTDVGYLAGNTLAGSRLNTAIKDTPVSIDVFTPELLKDLGATSLEQAMGYANNLQMDEGEGERILTGDSTVTPRAAYQFRSRGFLGTRARNYFETELPLELYIADRLDEARGPNSILFGIGSPGGIINLTTKSAQLSHSFVELEARYGSWDLVRGAADVNRVLVPGKAAVRVNGMYQNQKSWRDFLFTRKRGADVAGTWQPTRTMSVRGEYEEGDLNGTIAQNYSTIDRFTDWMGAGSMLTTTTGTAAVSTAEKAGLLAKFDTTNRFTYVANQGTVYNARSEYTSSGAQRGVEITGVPLVRNPELIPYRTNFTGPGARTRHFYRVGQFTIDQVITDTLSAQVAYYHENGKWRNYDVNAGTTAINSALRPDPNKYFRAGTISAGQLFSLDGFAYQTDANGTLNPNAGRPYFEANWRRRTASIDSDTLRASVTGTFKLGRIFGEHRLAGLVQRLWKTDMTDSAVEAFVGNPAGTVTSPTANANRLIRRQYGTFGDSASFAAPDWQTRPAVSISMGGKTYTSAFVPDQDPTRSDRTVDSFIIADQGSFWDNRLITTAGYRIDRLTQDRMETLNDTSGVWAGTNGIPVLDPMHVTRFEFQGHTRTLGAMFHVTKQVSLFANHSENIGLPNFTHVLGPDGTQPPPPDGRGKEAGIQLSLFGGRLFGRVTYYNTKQTNITDLMGVNNAFTPSYNFILQALQPYYTADQLAKYPELRGHVVATADTIDSSSEGYESRFLFNVTDRFRVLANYSYTDQAKDNPYPRTIPLYNELAAFMKTLDAANPNAAGPGLGVSNLPTKNPNPPGATGEISTIGQELAFRLQDLQDRSLDFIEASGARKHKANVTGSYSFGEGRLKGWTLGAGARYQSAMLIGYKPSTGERFYGNDSFLVDAMIRYATRLPVLGQRARLEVQLNVRNLLDNQALQLKRAVDTGEVIRWNFQTPREIILSGTIRL